MPQLGGSLTCGHATASLVVGKPSASRQQNKGKSHPRAPAPLFFAAIPIDVD
jgi:hypothetical protein